MTGTRSKIIVTLSVLALTALAFAVRILNWQAIFAADMIRPIEGDSFYQMRRVFLALENSLTVPEFDSYMNYPQGLRCRMPPLFNQFIAVIAFVLGVGSPSPELVQTVGALVPPVLAALTVPLVFLIARAYVSQWLAVLACAVFVFMPYHVQVSVLGRTDYHVAVVLGACALFVCLIRLSEDRSIALRLAWSVAAGACLALLLSLWIGSVIFVLILVVHFTIAIPASGRGERNRVTLGACLLFATALLIMWPVVSSTHWGKSGEITWTAISRFHLLLLAGCIAGVVGLRLLVAILRRQEASPGPSRRIFAIVAMLVILATAIVAMVRTGFLIQAAAGPVMWLLGKDTCMLPTTENLKPSFATLAENFTFLTPVFPLIIAVLVWNKRNTNFHGTAFFMLAWTLVIGTCTVMQERYADLFSVSAAILIAYVFSLLLDSTTPSTDHPRRFALRCPPVFGRRTTTVVLFAVFISASWPTLRWFSLYARQARAAHVAQNVIFDLCHWLREHTPPTSGYSDSAIDPGYSVLAGWSIGNPIVYVAKRPNVANNNIIGGYDETWEANVTPFRFFLTDDVLQAEAMLDKYRVKYVVVEEMLTTGHFAEMIRVIDLTHADFFESSGSGENRRFIPTQRLLNSMAIRLYIQNGRGLDRFKLVYESPVKTMLVAGKPTGFYKVFEYTKPVSVETVQPVSSN